MSKRLGKDGLSIGILKVDRQSELFLGPGHRHPEPQPDSEAGMTGRKPAHPERVPATPENEQLPPDGLDGISQHRHINTRP